MGKKKEAKAATKEVEKVIIEEVSEEAKAEAFKKISEAFKVFDTLNNDTCDVREVGTIMRSLNIYPTEEQVSMWLTGMQEEEPTGYVTLQSFSKIVVKLLTSNVQLREDEEIIYRAFQTLDVDKKGYLTQDELKQYMQLQGEAFSNEEMEEMLLACTDHQNEKKIFYENFLSLIKA